MPSISRYVRAFVAGMVEGKSRYELPHGAFTFTAFFVAVVFRASAEAEFYRTAAAMIPTLLLTLAVAGRFYVLDKEVQGFERYNSFFILLEIALGEAVALSVVAGVEPNAGFLGAVCGSLASVFVALAMVAMRGAPQTGSAD